MQKLPPALACLALLLTTAPLRAQEAEPDLDAIEQMAKSAPSDIARFIERKLECYHWAGEEPYDKARAREIQRAVTRLKCDSLERDESKLRKSHASNADVLKVLDAANGL